MSSRCAGDDVVRRPSRRPLARHARATGSPRAELPATAAAAPGSAAGDATWARLRTFAHAHPGVRASRFGIAFALGVITIVSPVIGIKGVLEPTLAAQAAEATLPRATAYLPPVEFVAVPSTPTGTLPANFTSSSPVELSDADLAALKAQGEAMGANQARAAMPDCSGNVVDPNAENGRLNLADLCALPWTANDGSNRPARVIRGDAALALARLNAEYAVAFGTNICVGDGYRSYEEQADVKARKPGLAAAAGASNHGWGLAVDLCGGIQDDQSPQWAWMEANAPALGWQNPDWARAGGKGPHEPWHWEFAAEVAKVKAAHPTPVVTAETKSSKKAKSSRSSRYS